MILGYPTYEQVEKYSTFELVRAKVLLPPPTFPHEVSVMELVEDRLGAASGEHIDVIVAAVGYGP